MQENSKSEKILYIFLLIMPFIDLFSSLATWNNWPSIGLTFKGLLLLYAIIYLGVKKKECWKYFIIIGVFCGLTLFINKNTGSIFQEITNLIKIFYLPTLILFFANIKNSYITPKLITKISLIYLAIYLLPYPFDLGHNISEIYPNKDLYLSYFYIGNELANIFILLIPIALLYLIQEKPRKYTIGYSILVICMLALLGTKAMYISVLLIFLYFLYFYRQKVISIIKKHMAIFSISILIVVISAVLLLPKTSFYQNIVTSLNFYEIDSIRELLSIENIDNIIYSNRLDFLANVHQEYMSSPLSQKMFGLGRSKILEIKDIEIDIFDIFYSIGIIGFIIYIWYMIFALRQKKLNSFYKFLFILLIIISLFSGHVLISPMVSTYVALLYGLKDEKEGREKDETMDQRATKKIKNRTYA